MDSEQPDLRVSDADRAAVTRALESAVGQGMLSLDEYTERVDAVLAARTRSELDAVIADLPVNRRPVAGIDGQPHELRSWMSSISRKGRWTVPPRLLLRTRMCSTTLDFTGAVVHGALVEIEIDDYLGSTELILPDGATADLNGVANFAASTAVKVAASPPSSRLHVVVRGRVRFGSLTARHPFGTTLRHWMSH
ncbi:hypothetical protein BST22_28005 [Mycolicibacterium chubuense]|uniref:DUF1707 domain-containing protein n=1 Tax=Mycolicibacterium chubuense TaxID=1800 RepID=A0A0J6WMQ3_MYCCU|nr:DUF1707 domain-containing protein [Mycolicibacterium chubuense]KMO83859.1 hypothetical protein MCHUDSM44219_01070 [Mycolicibacterium chubuense]ORA42756.1 hypothetical protein BST22_28005 [Mycolicibacterium chubuense]SPX98067.1 protein of uncharacterised function (DUF1707) [Mycolicibacterium chubuense]